MIALALTHRLLVRVCVCAFRQFLPTAVRTNKLSAVAREAASRVATPLGRSYSGGMCVGFRACVDVCVAVTGPETRGEGESVLRVWRGQSECVVVFGQEKSKAELDRPQINEA